MHRRGHTPSDGRMYACWQRVEHYRTESVREARCQRTSCVMSAANIRVGSSPGSPGIVSVPWFLPEREIGRVCACVRV